MRYLRPSRISLAVMLTLLMTWFLTGSAYADIPGREGLEDPAHPGQSRFTIPLPGTQSQELANITVDMGPQMYNVFEFPGTCVACHGGTIDQQAGHGGNWLGSSMASATRDPVFRAYEMITDRKVKAATGQDGGGSYCFRCHSPNAWYSGRFDPKLNGTADGSNMFHSIIGGTDDEGVMCETCHRAIGGATMKRTDLNPGDAVWNMLAGLFDWPHSGLPYPSGPTTGEPMGNGTLQFDDGMTYGATWAGVVAVYASDIPLPSTPYTGQTYGIYPPGFVDPWGNNVGGQPVLAADGSSSPHFEVPVGPPLLPDGTPDYYQTAISPEHSTFRNEFVRSPQFCGSCHDVSLPMQNHGMPQQRTYTEWRYSAYGDEFSGDYRRCQDCHMPRMLQEYTDALPVSINCDPLVSGWFPYAKERKGGTIFHKFAGSNRSLPDMMKVLYPEVDLELLGAQAANDPRVFPGMMSDRSLTWDRAKHNSEIMLAKGPDGNGAVQIRIVSGPTFNGATGKWEVKVRVTNNSGHRIPSGYPDGRRFWINLAVYNNLGQTLYQSGYYDQTRATLYNDMTRTGFRRALGPSIDSAANAVMVYEKRTGYKNPDNTYTISTDPLNEAVVFDNRIPPFGFNKAAYQGAGAKFWSYSLATNGKLLPYEDVNRYPDGQNFDLVTYSFTVPPGVTPVAARAELYWQTHTREFMEYLRDNDLSAVRPEGPPSIYSFNYPLDPNYLSKIINLSAVNDPFGRPTRSGTRLRDNWGGIAYAAWLKTGMDAPFRVAADDTRMSAAPGAPANVTTAAAGPFSIQVNWSPAANAEGYVVWIRYGISELTASWDRLAVVYGATTFLSENLNVGKTYGYMVEAFNGKGSNQSTAVVASTPQDLPVEPLNLRVVSTTASTVTLSWWDQATNETGFVIERQDVPPSGNFVEIARIPTPHPGEFGLGGVTWTDTGLAPKTRYNYRVASYNASGMSVYTIPGVQGLTK